MFKNVIDIDGAVLEGGGQILRIAVALGALLRKPIRIHSIRAGRKKPGLMPQHFTGLRLAQDLCDAQLVGGSLGSTEIQFHPGKMKSGKFSADTGTAGSIMLLFQVSFPCMLFASGPTEIYMKGGTNAEMAPQIDHTLMVFKPILEKFGVKFYCNLIRRGYFPKGGGEAVFTAEPIDGFLKPVEILDPGNVTEIFGRSYVAGVLPQKLAHFMADSAINVLREEFPSASIKIERVKESPHSAIGNGSGIVIVAKTSTGCLLAGSAVGKKEIGAHAVGQLAANQLLDDIKSGSCVDQFTQDQLVIFMVLAKGKSRIRCGHITKHTETAMYVAEQLTEAKFNIERHEGYCILECEGIGLSR